MRADGLPRRLFAASCAALVVAEAALVLLSWLVSATVGEGVRSLLGAEGVRWFVGSFVSMLCSPWLVWLLLGAMAGGCVWQSGVADAVAGGGGGANYRRRVALRVALAVLVLYVAGVLWLTAAPHAVLLSATGGLWPSPFSRSVVPLSAFGVLLFSVTFGWASGRFASVADVVGALSWGVGRAAPLFVLYVLLAQFCASVGFVLGV